MTELTASSDYIDLCIVDRSSKINSTVERTDRKNKEEEPKSKLSRATRLASHLAGRFGSRSTNNSKTPRTSITMSKEASLSALWGRFEEAGFESPDYIVCNGETWYRTSTKAQAPPFEEIEVVEDRSSELGKCININESLISYANRQYGKSMELNVTGEAFASNTSQTHSLKDARGLEIMFHRTVRMPDDEKIHQLPGSLGTFPIYNVAGYAEALPERIVRQGGLFMPMWQREALWLSLAADYSSPYALRVSVGHINAVSGLEMSKAPVEKFHVGRAQDYVVVPGQEWVDGICVAPGIVRQFVAMPLGSGYTVEGQKTGREKYGGLQIEIIPSFDKSLRSWLKSTETPSDPDELHEALLRKPLDEFKTPLELELGVKDKIRSFSTNIPPRVECVLSDIIGKKEAKCDVELKYHRDYTPVEPEYSDLGFSNSRRQSKSWLGGMRRSERSGSGLHQLSGAYAGEFGSTYGDFSLSSLGDNHYGLSGNHGRGEPEPFQLGCNSHAEGDNSTWEPESSQRYNSVEAHSSRGRDMVSNPHQITTDLTSMGLAAGGKLVQDIFRDSNPAHIWNTAAAKIVYVHILDPISCEAVTHVVPPPPPIDAMGYVEDGGQFFVVEEQPENRLEGGDFENIKSVSSMDREKSVRADSALDPTTPVRCKCGIRMCDCVVRPCGHVFCNVCIREIVPQAPSYSSQTAHASDEGRKCPVCVGNISWVAGFAAPMNLPGEEGLRIRVPVNVLKVEDGRVAFRSVQKSRI